ncbi:MAG: hypothetical protein QME92_07075 [Bacillota bacterium]|nr:hypothetical protein [Bacillota bacterium]
MFRNVYELNLDWNKLVPFLSRLAEVNDDFQEALSRFIGFVKALAEETLAP